MVGWGGEWELTKSGYEGFLWGDGNVDKVGL